MFMKSILPSFKGFCAREIVARDYDYIVPLESKGILLVNQVLRDQPEIESRVRYLRSFDFDEPEDIANKRIALVDDTVVFGRALEQAKLALIARGAKHVDKFACMLRVQEDSKADLSDVTVATKVSLVEYDLMLEELSGLTLQQRPTFPDHLAYAARFDEYHSTQSILLALQELGQLYEYRRADSHVDYSLHYPKFAPDLPSYASDSGPNKLRFRIGADERHITFSPGYFPSLLNSKQVLKQDDLVARIHESMTRPWQSQDVEALNLYEAFTLGLRMRFAANFVATLNNLGMRVARTDVVESQMAKYFGAQTAARISTIAREANDSMPRTGLGVPHGQTDESIEPVALTTRILELIKGAYDKHNERRTDRASWESIGLSVDELARRTRHTKEVVSFAVELLNDLGHIVPMHMIDGRRAERVYRSTELGGRKLAATYGATDC